MLIIESKFRLTFYMPPPKKYVQDSIFLCCQNSNIVFKINGFWRRFFEIVLVFQLQVNVFWDFVCVHKTIYEIAIELYVFNSIVKFNHAF